MMKTIKMMIAAVLLATAAAAQAEDGVARSAFTSAIQDREPTDQIGQLSNDNTQVYFFTEISGMNGHTITHRWEHGGEVRAEVTFNIGGDRWRVWSSKNLQPSLLGEWQVAVVDEGGNVIAQESFAYIPAGEQAATETGADPLAAEEADVDEGAAADADMDEGASPTQPVASPAAE